VVYLIVNGIVYFIWFVFVILLCSVTEQILVNVVHPLEALYSALINFAAASAFLFYGKRLYDRLNRLPVKSIHRHTILQKIGFLTVTCTIVFVMRSLLTIFAAFVLRHELIAYHYTTLVVAQRLLFLLGGEILPIWLIVFFLRRRNNTKPQKRSLIL
jgi:hypothetical protein